MNTSLKVLTKRYLILVGLPKNLISTKKYRERKQVLSSFTGLVTTAALNTKAKEIESKIPGITNQAAKSALTT